MSPPEASGGIRKLEDRYSGYDIVDPSGEKMGASGGVFADENGREYVEVKAGLVERALGTGYYLLPVEVCTVDDDGKTITSSADGETVKSSPYLDSALNVSPAHISRVRDYYGL